MGGKLLMGSALAALIAFAMPAQAAELPMGSEYDAGLEIYYYNYEEPNVMEQDGVQYGLTGSYEYHQEWVIHVDGRFAFGEVDYTSPISGTMDDLDNYTFETRGWFGWDFPTSETIVLTPYFGIGYRYLNNDSAGRTSSTGAFGYERESNYIYSPIGLAARAAMEDGWTLFASAEFDIFWDGTQESHLSDAVAGLSDLENDQNDGYGLRASLGVEKAGEQVDVAFNTFVRYWDIDDSEMQSVSYLGVTIGQGFEPENETVEIGGVLSARF